MEELLDFSRMQGGHLVMKFGRTDVLAELSAARYFFRGARRRRESSCCISSRNPCLRYWGIMTASSRVFINIIENAIKYSNRGGLIRVETADMGAHVQIVISDTGVGISGRICPISKVSFIRRIKPVGSGIGLALADEIVRRHKGPAGYRQRRRSGHYRDHPAAGGSARSDAADR